MGVQFAAFRSIHYMNAVLGLDCIIGLHAVCFGLMYTGLQGLEKNSAFGVMCWTQIIVL